MRHTSRVALVGMTLASLLAPRDAAGQLGFSWTPQSPVIGELVLFQVRGTTGLESVTWDFGGEGCGNYTQVTTCTPQFTDCLSQTFRYASSGSKVVSLTVVVGGSTLGPVTQRLEVLDEGSCGGGCAYTLDPSVASFSAGGGSGTVAVDASAPPCSWFADAPEAWIHLTGTTNGVGNGMVTFRVDPNTGGERTGTITIGGAAALVEQRAAPQRGTEVRVSPSNAEVDRAAASAVDHGGNRLVVWSQTGHKLGASRGGSPTSGVAGLFARRFDPSDTPVGDTVEVTIADGDANIRPTAAFDGSGRFVVGWQKRAAGFGIFGRLFDADGGPRGEPFRVSPVGGEVPEAPSVATGRSGQLAMAWRRGSGLYLREIAADGTALGDAVRVDEAGGLELSLPSVACDAAMRCLVVWHELDAATADGSGVILGRLFDRSGTPSSPVLVLSDDAEARAVTPSAGSDAIGNSVVVWAQLSPVTAGYDVFARRFGPGGQPHGGPFQVNLETAGHQLRPVVSVTAGGDFAVAWRREGDPGTKAQDETGIFARLYGCSGRPLSADVEVATPDDMLTPFEPDVELGDDLTVTVTYAKTNSEGMGRGVYLRTLRPSGAPRHEAFLPGVAHLPGYNETQWRTDVEVCNPAPEPAGYELAFLAAERANLSPPTLSFTLEPECCRRHEDVLLNDFELDPASGALRVVSPEQGVLVSARTFNNAPGGTYGSFELADAAEEAVEHGEEATFIHLSESADLNAGFRTNLGLLNVTAVPLTVEVDLRRSDGSLLGAPSFDLEPGEYRQVNRVFREVTASEVQDGFATLRTTTPGASFLAVASFIDNLTGDGVSLPALSVGGHERVSYLMGVAHVPGYNDTEWRSSLEVCSTAASALTYELAFLADRQENPAPLAASFVVAPGRCTRHEDVVRSAFGLDEGSGAIRLTAPAPELLVVGRTYNETPDGTYGSFTRASTASEAIGVEERGLLMHLSHSLDPSRGSRTNLLLVNLTPQQLDLQIELHRSNGDLIGTLTGTLQGFEPRQLNRVFATVTGDDVEDGYAVVSTPTPGGAFLAGASVVDNRSGDGVSIPCLKLR